ncbi:MAG: branched-chain amino acid transport system ATP-binding protein [Rhodospirillaceae bacterium]|nr:branched-chain amino acid transport system ATP-binding protein [Rhodospirillaceae bacterium]
MLKVESLSVSYGHIRAVREASFEVPDGRIVALIGANGAGKSSTLNALTGLVPRAGRVLFDGTDIAGLQTDAIVRHGVAQVAQGRQLFPEMSIRENLELGAFLRSPAQRRDSLAQLMQRFPFLKERAEQHCGTLSGGEQQLVAILRALMGAPRLLLLDEPTLGLAPLVVKNIGAIIRELHREGLSILIAEQNAAFACSLAEQIVVLENGHVALAGTPVELQARDDMRRSYLGV